MKGRFLPAENQNSFNNFWMENIKKERKGHIM